MLTEKHYEEKYRSNARKVTVAQPGDEELGPLQLLPGTWRNQCDFVGRGWNMIALPFAGGNPFDYRLLVNQYNEQLRFSIVDKGVPNRGIKKGSPSSNTDQFVVTIDYEQMVTQISADDSPETDLEGGAPLAIHHEPGLFLSMKNENTDNLDIARLATIPHGNAALGLGRSTVINGPPTIEDINGLPIGVPQDIENNPYLAPYKHFNDNPFKGAIKAPGFPGFNPVSPNDLLKALPQGVKRTTVLPFDTKLQQAGIHNIPFIEQQADASEMVATFYVMELEETDLLGNPKLIMAYTQTVMLDFFPRRDGVDGLIKWPHVSINVMEKSSEPINT